MEYVLTGTKTEARAGSYYDKIAAFYDLTFKLNGYGRSLDQYFANHPLPDFSRRKDSRCRLRHRPAHAGAAAFDTLSGEHHCARSLGHFNYRRQKSSCRESRTHARRHVCRRKSLVASLRRQLSRSGGYERRARICPA